MYQNSSHSKCLQWIPKEQRCRGRGKGTESQAGHGNILSWEGSPPGHLARTLQAPSVASANAPSQARCLRERPS